MSYNKNKDLILRSDEKILINGAEISNDGSGLKFEGVLWSTVSGGGITDHGDLTGLADDDHTQYHTNARGDARYYTKTQLDSGQLDNRYYTESEVDNHNWTESDITDLDKYTQAEVTTISGDIVAQIPSLSGYATESYVDNADTTLSGNLQTEIDLKIDSTGVTFENLNANGDVGTGSSQVAQGNHIHDDIYYTKTQLNNGQLDSRYYTQAEVTTISGDIVNQIVTDHGDLTGLADDDHTQYHTDSRGDARYYTKTQLDAGQLDSRYYTESEVDAHNWTESDITDLDKYTQAEVTTISGDIVSQIITDHGELTGLADDDHPQYHNDTRGDARYYTKTQLNNGQLDSRYYTESEVTTISGDIVAQIITDHGSLTGLSDDDHTQYHTDSRGDARYYTKTQLDAGQLDSRYYTESEVDAHNWTEADITDLDKYTQAEVDTISGSLNNKLNTHKTSSDHDNRYYTESEVTTISGDIVNQIVTDHGELTGLADDDHTQYHNDTRGDARYYTQTQLNNGQLDVRYYTETEINTWRNGTTQTEMGYVHGVTSDIQTQLNGKLSTTGKAADSDKLDNHDSSYFLNTSTTFGGDVSGTYNNIAVANDSHTHDTRYYTESESDSRFVKLTDYDDSDVLTKIKNVDGSGSGLDADLLDGHNSSYFLNTSTTFGGDVSGTYNNIVVANDSHTHDTRYYTESEVTTISGDIVNQIVTDHGELTGLSDDDHTQYYNSDRLNAWSGSNNITTLGIISTGSWQGTPIANSYVAGIDQDLLQSSSPTFEDIIINNIAEINGSLSLLYGTSINEFSTDTTLAGNSDNAVPTEKAVKTYIDNLASPWDSIQNYNNSLSQMVTSVGSGTATILIDTTTDEVTSNLTIPNNIHLVALNEADIPVASGTVLTINSFDAGKYKVFSGDGSVSFGDNAVLVVFPEWWKKNSNPGTTDMTSAIQSAVNSLSRGVVSFGSTSYLTGQITLKPSVAMIGSGVNRTTLLAKAQVSIFSYTASSTVSYFHIEGISFKANTYTGSQAISIDGTDSSKRCTNIRIKNIYAEYFYYAIHLKYTANTFIERLFATVCNIGIRVSFGADTDIVNCKVQNGNGSGFYIDGGTGAYDEGVRLTSCSTNGQHKGLTISNQEWGIATGCSFTTCQDGALIMASSSGWKFTGCEFSVAGATPSSAGANLDSSCHNIIFIGNYFALNTFGVVIGGQRNTVVGNIFLAGSNVDIMINGAKYSTISGNVCDSTGVSSSIFEAGGSDYSNIVGNTINGTISTSGAHTSKANNITY